MNCEGQKIYRDKETSFPDDNNTYKEIFKYLFNLINEWKKKF